LENLNFGCEACRDLLPLYADGVVSGESKGMVEAHIAGCEACRTELTRLRTVLPMLKKSPKKAMRTVKQKLRIRRVLIGAGAGLGAAALLTGLFAFVLSHTVPVKTAPKDLKFSVADGVFRAASAVDSQFTEVRMVGLKAQDGGDVNLVIFSMGNPAMRKLWPSLNRRIYTMGPSGILFEEHGMEIVVPLAFPEPPELPELPESPEPYGFPWFFEPPEIPELPEPPEPPELPDTIVDVNPEGKGLWRVYFVRESDYRLGRVVVDRSAGKLTEKSMQYAKLVWEQVIE
jgi:hypothetical protein